ncbi:phospholipase A1-like [Haematobia irritans]|uniref:Putative phospholipase a1-like protein n=1 Tax=Haematobia irritans TaxID=7368 RepID=A0A1L8EGD8_HAEIR
MKTLLLVYVSLAITLALVSSSPLRISSLDLIENRATGDVKFYLYTSDNPSTAEELFIGNEDSVKKSHFEKSRPTRIIIHGWGGSYTSTPNKPIREAYLSKDNYNVISVDWNAYSELNYISARAKVPIVGEDVAEFIDFLNQKFGMSFSNLVVIGHSLGAHVAGYCGKNVKRGTLEAIVGLDPAYPLYSYENTETRLASTDAKYVETIQTNGNVKGFLKPIGTASFYPNWGRNQPGCGTDIDGSCSHGRCVTLYAEAIKGYSFAPIYKCKSYDNILDKNGCNDLDATARIGDPLHINRTPGIFYFTTNSEAPYGHLNDRS